MVQFKETSLQIAKLQEQEVDLKNIVLGCVSLVFLSYLQVLGLDYVMKLMWHCLISIINSNYLSCGWNYAILSSVCIIIN
jgi:hypothetical protein